MLLKPPPEKITCSHAPSGSVTFAPGLTWVAPTEVTKGQPEGKEGLNRIPAGSSVPGRETMVNQNFEEMMKNGLTICIQAYVSESSNTEVTRRV